MIGKIITAVGVFCGLVGIIAGQSELGFIQMWGCVILGFLFEWRFEDDTKTNS